jgi:glucose/arabinose dehydrogenase
LRDRRGPRWITAALAAALLGGAARAADLQTLTVPDGFAVGVFASGLGAVRFMTVDPGGALLASVPDRGVIIALPDRDGDGRADGVETVVAGLDRPHGLAIRAGRLYVGETGRVVRLRYDTAAMRASQPEVVVPDLPHGGHHWTRTIAFSPDGALYVAIGSSCDVCREGDPRRATVMQYSTDTGQGRPFATGLRSVVGLTVHPRTGSLWATVNERDWRAGGAPPDYVTRLVDRGFYGWPGCYVQDRLVLPDPELRDASRCGMTLTPTVEVTPHSAPLGLTFYTGQGFPREYRGNLFVAYHGSRPGLRPIAGHKVVRLLPDERDFMTGFVQDGRVLGRPVDLITGGDGALYVSDDHAGAVYRVVHRGGLRAARRAGAPGLTAPGAFSRVDSPDRSRR